MLVRNIVNTKNMFSSPMINLISYGIGLLVLSFIPCYIGNEIQSNSQKTIENLYLCDWTQINVERRKKLIFMQTILQAQPIKVKVGGIFVVNLETFLKLMNTAYSMIAFLKSLEN